jgi:hypothetical protein
MYTKGEFSFLYNNVDSDFLIQIFDKKKKYCITIAFYSTFKMIGNEFFHLILYGMNQYFYITFGTTPYY